jgi:hypothetical protein
MKPQKPEAREKDTGYSKTLGPVLECHTARWDYVATAYENCYVVGT